MPFGMLSVVGRGMGVLDEVVIVEEKGQFWGEFGASHCNQRGLCDAALPKLLWAALVYLELEMYGMIIKSRGQHDKTSDSCTVHSS